MAMFPTLADLQRAGAESSGWLQALDQHAAPISPATVHGLVELVNLQALQVQYLVSHIVRGLPLDPDEVRTICEHLAVVQASVLPRVREASMGRAVTFA